MKRQDDDSKLKNSLATVGPIIVCVYLRRVNTDDYIFRKICVKGSVI